MDTDRTRYEAHEDNDKDGDGDLPAKEYYEELIESTHNACNIIRWCCKEYRDTLPFATKNNAGLLDDLVFLYESLHTPCHQGVFGDIGIVLSEQIEHLSAALQDMLPTLTAVENTLRRMIPPQA